MEYKSFADLPREIQEQIESLLPNTGLKPGSESLERLASVWIEKYAMFCAQTALLDMVFVDSMAPDDARGVLLLTYSGSLISLGPSKDGKRWLEYASIKFRTNVPEVVKADSASLASGLHVNEITKFEGTRLRQSSSLFRIAVCAEDLSPEEQDKRIREATIFLTDGFVTLNRSLLPEETEGPDRFTNKGIIAHVARKNGLTQEVVKSVIEDYVASLESGLLAGDRLHLGKIGRMSLKPQAARKARIMKNIKTGEDILIPARAACMVPRFVFTRDLKEKCSLLEPEKKDAGY